MTERGTRRTRGRPRYPGTFTPAEQRVLAGLRRGQTYQAIADELGLSYDTVKYHVSNMLGKAGVESREELVAFSRRPGIRWAALPAALLGGVATLAGLTVAVVALAVVLARGDDASEPAGAVETPSAATGTPGGTPPAAAVPVTGVDIVDAFIAAALSGDMTKIEPLIEYGSVLCSNGPVQGIGSPPACPPGSPEGSSVPALVTGGGCHGSIILPAEMHDFLANWNLGFDGVFSASTLLGGGDVVPPVWYTVVLTFKQFGDGSPVREPRPGIEFHLDGNGVTDWSGWCGESARGRSTRYTNYLISPPPLPAVPKDTPHTGEPKVDETIDALAVRDLLTLQERTATIEVGCGSERWLPRCYRGGPDGTLVPAVIRDGCERSWAAPDWLGGDYDSLLGPAPAVFAIARGNGEDGVAYWVIYDASIGQATGGG